jgi:hypothetical protein
MMGLQSLQSQVLSGMMASIGRPLPSGKMKPVSVNMDLVKGQLEAELKAESPPKRSPRESMFPAMIKKKAREFPVVLKDGVPDIQSIISPLSQEAVLMRRVVKLQESKIAKQKRASKPKAFLPTVGVGQVPAPTPPRRSRKHKEKRQKRAVTQSDVTVLPGIRAVS